MAGLLTTNGSGGAKEKRKNFFLTLVVFSKNKKKTRSVYRLLRILPYLVMAFRTS